MIAAKGMATMHLPRDRGLVAWHLLATRGSLDPMGGPQPKKLTKNKKLVKFEAKKLGPYVRKKKYMIFYELKVQIPKNLIGQIVTNL